MDTFGTHIRICRQEAGIKYVGLNLWNEHLETNLFTSVDKSLHVKANLEDFWNLETIGINDSPVDPKIVEASARPSG